MVLKFHDAPLGVDDDPVCVVITAQDTDSGEHVECRIMHHVLMNRYGAHSIARDILLTTFNDNREEILEVAQRKYTQGSVERTANGVRLFLELADFGPI